MIPPPTPDTTYDECERMLYDTYQAQRDLTEPFLTLAGASARALRALPPSLAETVGVRHLSAAYEVLSRARLTHERPPFGIDSVVVRGRSVAVHEEVTTATPFCSLVHFAKKIDGPGPPVLLIAPLSGHFATLLRETASTMLREFDVYITDWHNARDMPVAAGRFGLDEYIDHVIGFVETIGPHVHVLAVCQPCVPALAATALMSTDRHTAVPKSLTLMAGPIDARVNPTPRERAGVEPIPRVVRAHAHHRGPGPVRGCAAAGVPGLPPARGVHGDESRSARALAFPALHRSVDW